MSSTTRPVKTCTKCNLSKSALDFYKGSGVDGRRSRCKSCHNHDIAERLEKKKEQNPQFLRDRSRVQRSSEQFRIQERYANLLRRYGLSADMYDKMYDKFDGGCWICLTGLAQIGQPASKGPYVDHDHASGKVRGLLCPRCNHLVHGFDEGLMERVKQYVAGEL